MTTAVMRSPRARIVGRPGCWLSVRHSLRTETAGALTCASTELGEGVIASTNPPAVDVLLAGAAGATFLALVSRS